MAADIIAIMDHEGVGAEGVIGVAHDWGTYLLSQLAFRYPLRFEKLVFLSVPYSPPGRPMDIASINKATRRKFGFEQFGYWLFLASDGAGKLMGENWESFFSIVYPATPSIWKTAFAPIGGLRDWLASKSKTHVASYITDEDKQHHHKAFGNDYSACNNWYKRGIRNLGVEEEKKMLEEGKIQSRIGKETLMVTGLRDVVCTAQRARVAMGASVERGRLRVVDLDAGHWVMLESAEETNRVLEEFFEGRGVRSVL